MTIRQKQAIKNTLENGGNITQAMKDAKYKEATINNPKNLTESKAWIQLMQEHLPDNKLLEKHKEALEAVKQIGAQILIDNEGEVIKRENEGMIEVPDYPTRLKAVELGYKIKGKYQDTQINILNQGDMDIEFIDNAGK